MFINRGLALSTGSWPEAEETYNVQLVHTEIIDVTQSLYTFTDVPFGKAHPTREIIVTVGYETASVVRSLTAASSTIGGVTVTKLSPVIESVGGAGVTGCFASVPTGTSGSISLQFNNTCTTCFIAVYRIIKRPGQGTNSSDNGTTNANGVSINTINTTTVNANEFLIYMHYINKNEESTRPAVPATMTTDYAALAFAGPTYGFITCAHSSIQASTSTPTMTWDWTTNGYVICVVWAFA